MTTFWMCAAILATIVALVIWLAHRAYIKDLKFDIGTLSDVNEKLNKEVDQKAGSINQLFEMIESISQEKVMYRKRVIELENAVEQGYGVTVRREVTNVIVDFNKLEMVILLSGVHKLLKGSKTTEDAEFYINLIKKLQKAIDKMPEDKEEEKQE